MLACAQRTMLKLMQYGVAYGHPRIGAASGSSIYMGSPQEWGVAIHRNKTRHVGMMKHAQEEQNEALPTAS